jgi:hypothetical protein
MKKISLAIAALFLVSGIAFSQGEKKETKKTEKKEHKKADKKADKKEDKKPK